MIRIKPSREACEAHAGDHTHVALSTAVIVDGETPVGLYRRLGGVFLLESVEGGEMMGRYSFIGLSAAGYVRFDDGEAEVRRGSAVERFAATDPLTVLEAELAKYRVWVPEGLPRFSGGAVGYLSFDCAACFEDIPLPAKRVDALPMAFLQIAEELLVYDHVAHRLICIVHARLDGDRGAAHDAASDRLRALIERVMTPAEPAQAWIQPDASVADLALIRHRDSAEFQDAVRRAKEAIVAGEVFQVVPSQRFSVVAQVDPLELYRSLRALNPSPYMFLLRFPDVAVVGASPEVLVRVEDGEVLVRPIAGTRRRGADDIEDRALAAELLADPKELAEHRMLVDLGRNDVGRVAEYGSVRVEDPLHIERYAAVMHIVTDVRGTLRAGATAFDAFRACFPAGTVSGAPKIRACTLLAELEPHRRGLYAGAVGYFDFAGNMDTCIAIRSLVVEAEQVHAQAGAGIVYDSDPATEDAECAQKVRSALTAVALTLARQETR
ncbi:MAG: anthranilate synthase component 1 [Bradymonadia bacterium]|jgi:anthranilate synthase component 1